MQDWQESDVFLKNQYYFIFVGNFWFIELRDSTEFHIPTPLKVNVLIITLLTTAHDLH